MATCRYCQQDIRYAVSCEARTLCRRDGTIYARIPFGFEAPDDGPRQRDARCPNCQVAFGMPHHPGCITEECPRCYQRLAECHCGLTIPSDQDPPAPRGRLPLHQSANLPHQSVADFNHSEVARPSSAAVAPTVAMPTWQPSERESAVLRDLARLGRLSGCWEDGRCRLSIEGDRVRHERDAAVDLVPVGSEDLVISRLRALHVKP